MTQIQVELPPYKVVQPEDFPEYHIDKIYQWYYRMGCSFSKIPLNIHLTYLDNYMPNKYRKPND